jgi:hypothetical protein
MLFKSKSKYKFCFCIQTWCVGWRFACVRGDEFLGLGFCLCFLSVNPTTKLFDKFGATLHRNFYIKIRHTYIFDYKELKKIFEPKVKRRRNGAEKTAYNKLCSCFSAHSNTHTVIQSTNDRMERKYTHGRYEHFILRFGRTAERNTSLWDSRVSCVRVNIIFKPKHTESFSFDSYR